MANAVNIAVGLDIRDLVSSFKFAGAAANDFTTRFGASFAGITRSAAQPAGAFNELTRNLQRTQREIRDVLATGGSVSSELTSRYAILTNRISTVNNAFNPTPALTGFAALNQRLTETRQKMQDLLVTGQPVPQQLTTEYRRLEAEVNQVGRALERLPSSAQRLTQIGTNVQSVGRNLSTYLTAPLVLAGGAAFKSYAEIDALIQGFKVTAGSVAGANQEFREYYKLSQNPGLGFEEVERAGLKFEALGFKSKVAQKNIAEIGNAIALGGGSKVDFQSVITQFTQMSSKAKVLGDDLKPILNSSPVIAKAINEMFGSTNSEDVSKKLQAAGKGPKDFLEELVANLAKLERAQAGPLNAIENFGDAVKIAGFEFGKTADKTFNLTDKINGLGVFVGVLAEDFGKLNPTLQATILGVTGLVTAVGPLLLGVGTVIRLLPVMGTALAALASPFALIAGAVAALGVGAYGIYSFNRAVESSVDSSKLLADTQNSVSQAIGTETNRLSALLKVARDETQSKQARQKAISEINAISPAQLGFLSLETINTKEATAAVNDYTRAIRLRAQSSVYATNLVAAQAKLEAEKAIPKKDRVSALERTGARASSIGAYVGVYTEANKKITALEDARSKQAIADAQAVVDFNQRGLDLSTKMMLAAGIKSDKPTITPTNYLTGFSDSELKQAKDRLKVLRDKIFEGNGKKIDVSDLEAEARTIKAQIDAVSKSIKPVKVKVEIDEQAFDFDAKTKTYTDKLKAEIENLQTRVSKRVALGLTVDRSTLIDLRLATMELDGYEAELKKIGEASKVIAPVKANIQTVFSDVTLTDVAQVKTGIGNMLPKMLTLPEITAKLDVKINAEGTLSGISNQVGTLTAGIPKIFGGLTQSLRGSFDDAFDPRYFAQPGLAASLVSSLGPFNEAVQAAKQAFVDARKGLGEGAVGVLEGIGEAIGAGKNPLEGALKGILDTIGDYLIKQGLAMLLVAKATSLAGIALAAVAGPGAIPLLAQSSGSTIAAGALIVGGGLVKGLGSQIGSYASGGVFTKPTVGLFAEYAHAGRDPEVASPVSLMAKTFKGVLREYTFTPPPINYNMNQIKINPNLSRPQLLDRQPQTIILEERESRLRGGDIYLAGKRHEITLKG